MAHWPHERSLVNRLKKKPFALIGVNIMRHDPKSLKKVMVKEKINWRTFADMGEITKQWNTPPTPAFYVIDPKGIIRHKWIGHPGEKAIDETLHRMVEIADK